MKKQLGNDQIARIIERENVITFKRKNEHKSSLKSQKDQEEDPEPNYNEDSLHKNSKRNQPLPELNRERKKMIPLKIQNQAKPVYLEKEVRQHDNLMLKNINNHLTNQNMQLKTKNMNLEKEILRLQKVLDEDPQKAKTTPINKQMKVKGSDSISLKIAMRNLKKQLQEARRESTKIKTSIKFTTISELETERDSIFEESQRLRSMLEEEHNRLNFLKANMQGFSSMEQKTAQMQDKINYLTRQNGDLKMKLNGDKGGSKFENDKNANKMLYLTKKMLKEKEKQIELLKNELKKINTSKGESLKVLESSPLLQNSRNIKSQFSGNKIQKIKITKQKRLMSKSAQKYRSGIATSQRDHCPNCIKCKDQIHFLNKQIQSLKAEVQQLKIYKHPIGALSKTPIKKPTAQEILLLKRFLVHRFKAHHLTADQALLHLLSIEGQNRNLQQQISTAQLLQVGMAQPFSVLSDRYIEIFIIQLCYKEQLSSQEPTVNISQLKKVKRRIVKDNFQQLIGQFELLTQNKEEEMFIQIAQLVTQYQQHILKALNQKKNSQSTIQQHYFYQFFRQIELEDDYIDFMISQIILQSLDLEHLNIYNLFEIFYMPQEQEKLKNTAVPKKKYHMIESVVKQEDEEYEESKSFLQSRQKSANKDESGKQEEDYNEGFEEEKMENAEQEKANEQETPKPHEHYQIEHAQDQYVDDYQS